jgi:uncharacterized repeat protein (TIGR01451 family)
MAPERVTTSEGGATQARPSRPPVLAVLRSPTARWVAVLASSLAVTLIASVNVAVRAPDHAWSRAEARAVSYAALGSMQEVNFETEMAFAQAPRARSVAPVWTITPTPTGTGTLSPRPSPRPTSFDPEPPEEPIVEEEEEDDGDLGDELGSPDPLTVSAASNRATAGQSDAITYSFSVKNVSSAPVENIVAEMHIPAGTYAAGSCSGLVDEGTMQPPVCADVPGLPATGSDDHHVLRVIGTLQPGQQVAWTLKVRVGADTSDGATIINHTRARAGSIVVPSDEVLVLVV